MCNGLRQRDTAIGEQVLMFHIAVGGHLAWAHNGVLYTYDDGCRKMYTGVMPELIVARCRSYFVRLEGLFMLLPESTGQVTDEDMLALVQHAIDDIQAKQRGRHLVCAASGGLQSEGP